ncbi:MAG TPA: 30S ribosomal protein S16 [Candidatus Paceibacterota bacterium]|nr:30S ribosomal protein S16 [Candidatus Paceibacterota bacterium]
MITIRFKRVGKKHQPSYRVIVTDKNLGGPKGKAIEYLGWYNPLSKKYSLKKERISYWLSQGAQTSDSLYNLLVKDGIITDKKKVIKIKPKKKAKEEKGPESSSVITNQEAVEETTEAQIKPEVEVEEAK